MTSKYKNGLLYRQQGQKEQVKRPAFINEISKEQEKTRQGVINEMLEPTTTKPRDPGTAAHASQSAKIENRAARYNVVHLRLNDEELTKLKNKAKAGNYGSVSALLYDIVKKEI